MANNKVKSAMIRYKNFKKEGQRKPYTAQSQEFFRLYKEQLNDNRRKLFNDFLFKRQSLMKRMAYSLTTPLYRQNKRDTIIFKLLYSINKY